MRLLAALCAAALAAATPAFAHHNEAHGSPHAAAPSDSVAIVSLLRAFLDGASRNDAAAHDRFWADDLIYTGSGGRRIGKADIMKDVRESPPPAPGEPVPVYGAEDIHVHQYGDAAYLAFRLTATTATKDSTSVANYLNSGMIVKRGGRWQVVGWQATKKP